MFSIITPTHNPAHLDRLYYSLKTQVGFDLNKIEWIIAPNNGLVLDVHFKDAPFLIRVVPVPDAEGLSQNIGYIKKYAFHAGNNEYLVELDHDDVLVPTALAKLATAIKEHDNPEFLYSDAVHIRADDTTETYSGRYGWAQPYIVPWQDKKYPNNPAFAPVSAASLHDIFYSPDHVRVWNRTFYRAIGGHNKDLFVADDHDLLQRTYIEGGRMVYVPHCLYIYHVHEDHSNSYLVRNAQIQKQQALNGDKHRAALIREWCRREKLLRVELGGGQTQSTTGVLGVALKDADLNYDIMDKGLIFKDNSVGHIHAQDFLEHIPHCHSSSCSHNYGNKPICVVGMMNEIWRVLAPNGWFTSSTPSTDGRGAFQDPTHVSFWNPNSFWYYTQQAQHRYLPGNPQARFIAKRVTQGFPSQFHVEHNIPYVDAVLIALKKRNQPGDNGFWPSYP